MLKYQKGVGKIGERTILVLQPASTYLAFSRGDYHVELVSAWKHGWGWKQVPVIWLELGTTSRWHDVRWIFKMSGKKKP